MTSFQKTKVTPYTAEQMYHLVDQVEHYSAFVPWCVSSAVTHRTADAVSATLRFARGGFSYSFSTINRVQPHKLIEIRLLEGPFKHLEGFWQFEALSDCSSRVRLDLEFELASKILTLTFGPMLHQVANTLVDVFCKRAELLYGV